MSTTDAARTWTLRRRRAPIGPTPWGLRAVLVLAGVAGTAITLMAMPAVPAWAAIGGTAVAGGVGVWGLMAMARRVEREYRGLAAIRQALALAADESAGGVEQSAMALGISAHFGPEASAFQAILNQRAALKQQVMTASAEQRLAARSAGAGGATGELAGACDALWIGIMLVDADLRVIYANGAAGVFSGRKRDELVKSGLHGVIEDEKLLGLIKNVASGQVRTRQSVEVRTGSAGAPGGGGSAPPSLKLDDGGERRGTKPAPASAHGGTAVLRYTVRPVRREDFAAAMVVIEDVTQQRVADEARNSFVAHATHELRTPLTNIRLYVDELVESGEQDAAVRGRCVNVIGQEARRLERIVGDLLSVSEIEAGSMKLRAGDVRLGPLFEELEADHRPLAASKQQTLTIDLPPKLPVLQGDRDKLGLALHNLVGNAVKYTPEGGSVTVKAFEEPGWLVVEVTDTGIGIREDERELIFDRFYRARDQRIAKISGSGLGLALAREIARLHGGDITVKSELNKGSTFALRVPVAAAVRKAA